MYICVRFPAKRRVLSNIEYANLNKNAKHSYALNYCKLYSTKPNFAVHFRPSCLLYSRDINHNIFRNFGTLTSGSSAVKDNPVHAYLVQRDHSKESESQEDINKTIISKLDHLTKHLEVKLDSIAYDLNHNEHQYNYIHPSHRYPKESFSSEGFINLSLTNSELYTNFVSENRIRQFEESTINRKLKPSTRLFNQKGVQVQFNENEIQNVQSLLDANIANMVKTITFEQSILLIRRMYLLGLSVSYSNFCELLNSLKSLNKLSPKELVELAICVRAYVDSDNSFLRYFMVSIGSTMQNKVSAFEELPNEKLIDFLFPLSLMQFNAHPFSWLIVSNPKILNKITEEFDTLPVDYKAKLFTILSSLVSSPEITSKYYSVYETLINSLQESIKSISSNEILSMMSINVCYPNFEVLREALFKEALNRWSDFPSNSLAMLYLKHKDEIPRECSDQFLENLGLNLRSLNPKYLPELYCTYLKNGQLSKKQCRSYEYYLGLRYTSLTIRNISNLLMYLSINGKSTCRIYGHIIRRFQQLKDSNSLSNQQLLDVVLSMSLVGIHTRNVWNNVNLSNLVFQTPKNILVYLGYAFLITNLKDHKLWNVLLQRILGENKHYNSETYEVLKSAEILKFIPKDQLNSTFNRLLQQCKPLYFSKLARQRYRSKVPYEKMFEKLEVRYKKEIIINELYEAPYVLPEFGIIIEPTRDQIKHQTSGCMIGEAMLRQRVWSKLNYRTFSFHDSEWEQFYREDADGNSWDIDKMVMFFCKNTRLNHLVSSKGMTEIYGIFQAKKDDQC
uniref:RAP domain-containing protein n=1 Tax=Theileria annulata TaxID=5874 RepID=A0A3B0MTV7_THEAN